MKLIVGLGNPGEKYEKTRHNLGFMAVDRFFKDYQPVGKTVWEDSKKTKSEIAQIEWDGKNIEKVMLAKPKTYMNNSGMAVKLVTSYWQIAISDVWVIHDDIDLPLGSIKIRFGGGSAGHKGIQSIIDALGTDKFWRFRLGIGKESSKFKVLASRRSGQSSKLREIDDFVLSQFGFSERGKVRELIKKTSKAIQTALEQDLEKAMNRFNAK